MKLIEALVIARQALASVATAKHLADAKMLAKKAFCTTANIEQRQGDMGSPISGLTDAQIRKVWDRMDRGTATATQFARAILEQASVTIDEAAP